jgi:recombination protein RecT
MSTLALQKTAEPGPLKTVSDLLTKYKEQIAMALPRHLTPERMIRVALTAVSRSQTLQKCSPATIAGCVVQASILGLEPDGVLGEAYLVPFYNKKANNGKGGYECQLIPGYQGLLKLVRNTGELKMIDVQEVCANDEFDFEKGMEPYLRHKPAVGDRGEVLKIWAGAVLTNGGKQFEVMTLAEIEQHRDKYSKSAESGPWVSSPEWMYKKTVLRKLVKLLPKSAQAQLAVALDERAEIGIPQRFTVDVPIELQQSDAGEAEAEGETLAMPQRKSEAGASAPPTGEEIEAECKRLRKMIREKYSTATIEQHGGAKMKDMGLDALVQLRDGLEEAA